ncbi:MAG: transglutaminase domain-containing protein [Desulforhopalus sp.]
MKKLSLKLSNILRLLIVTIWGVLFILLVRRDVYVNAIDLSEQQTIRQAASTEYQSIYFRNDKIGFIVNDFKSRPDNTLLLKQHALMHLNVAGAVQTIELNLRANLSASNLLKNFSFSFQSPFYRMQTEGTVNGNVVSYKLATGSNTIRDTIIFTTPPLLSSSRRPYLLTAGVKTGEKRKISWFDPVSLTGKESIVEYHGKDSVLINGRVHALHRFTESFSGIRVNSWLDDSGIVIKEESPAGFVFLKEPQFKALNLPDTGEEILASVSIKTQTKIPEELGKSMQYRLYFPQEIKFDLHGGRQQYQDNILTITRENIPADSTIATCPDIGDSLTPSAYIQSDHQEIKELTRKITSGALKPTQRVQKLSSWVYKNLDKRSVIGLPDALTTLKNRQGDCNEHAALMAAMARSVAIPTRIAAGVTYHKDAFYYHAWNEVCLGDRWVSIDTTTNQFPADLTHLKFIQGELQEQVRISGLLGRLTIEPILQEINHE